jgi:signal recognition particle subunit SRP54
MLELGEEKLEGFKIIMDSMTKAEKQNPDIINSNRIARIAKGAGKTQEQVRELLKQFKQMKKAFKKLKDLDETKLEKGFDMGKLAQMFGKKKKLKIR